MDTKETILYQLLTITSVMVTGIVLYAFLTAILQEVKYRWIRQQEMETEINALEDERKRIAADLHDDLGPVLSSAKMKLSALGRLEAADAALVNSSIGYLDNISNRIRTIAAGLLPSVLEDKGLVTAVEYFIQSLGLHHGLCITLHAEPIPHPGKAIQVHMYRILQEIIHNSCKHGNAGRLQIYIQYRKNAIILATVDDGTGFDYFEVKRQKKGYGLMNIRNRIQLLNGIFHIESAGGTRYYIEIPLPVTTEKNLF